MKTRNAIVAGLAGAAIALAGCAAPDPAPADGVEVDVPDCDAEDRRKNETPDCGRIINGRFQPWSWVKAGRTTAPLGWTPASEPRPTATAAPARTRATATRSAVAPPKRITTGGSLGGKSKTGRRR